MDNRLVFAVLFVTLSCVSVGTYAQATANTTTTMAPSNVTTMAPSNVTTMAPSNMTTMAPSNVTTMAPSNMTTMTTMAITTTARPLVPNTTVEALQANITRTGCGTEQLCAAEPSSCDPSSAASCFFLAAKRQSGQNFEFALAGESEGYLAATLSTDTTLGGNDVTYVCANNNNVVQFFGALLNDGMLSVKELNVNSVKGRVRGGRIECTFAATVPISTVRTTNFAIGISTGPFNSTTGALGTPQTQLRSGLVNLSNTNATVTNEISDNSTTTTASPNTTNTTNTTNHGITFQQSLTQALLISAGILCLTLL